MELTSFPGYVPGDQLASAEEDCTICIEKLGTDTKVLDCNHVFHQKCINTWLSVSNTCPVCRNPGEVFTKTTNIDDEEEDFVVEIGVNNNYMIRESNTDNVDENPTNVFDIVYKILVVVMFVGILVTSGMLMYYHLKIMEFINLLVVNETNASDIQNVSSISYFQNSSTNSSDISNSSTKISVYNITILVLMFGASYGAQLVAVLGSIFGKKKKWLTMVISSLAVLIVIGFYIIDINSALEKLKQSEDYELKVDKDVKYIYNLSGIVLTCLLIGNIFLNGAIAFLNICRSL
jgi:hypothetical protein